MPFDPDLPDELQGEDFALGEDAPATPEDARAARLEALGVLLAGKRDDAIKAREESGIEATWIACEEAYIGIDDANRGEFPANRWAKPTTPSGPLTSGDVRKSTKATAFVPLTARYVDMGRAKVCELLLPVDDKAFTLDVPSSPDQQARADVPGAAAAAMPEGAAPGAAPMPAPTAPAAGAVPGQAPAVPAAPAPDPIAAAIASMKVKAKKAEDWIYDRLKESRYPKQMRKVVHDAARLGVGVLKGPFPNEVKSRVLTSDATGIQLTIKTQVLPGCGWINPWNLFPARGCGENIHDGDLIWERDYFSPGRLSKLKDLKDQDGNPIYLTDALEKVIEEGPGSQKLAQSAPSQTPDQKKTNFEVWTMHGRLSAQDMQDLGAPGAGTLPKDVVECFAIVTLVNETVIRATVNPLESGKFPYRVLNWQRRVDHWAGIGVGERVKFPQGLINAATRAIINNAGKSAGSHIALDRRSLRPSDGTWDMNVGDKVYEFTGEGLVDDIRKIFFSFQIPNLTAQLMPLVEYAQKLAEEATNISLQTQGHAGKFDPDTFGQAEMQDDNAHTLLRDLAYEVDDTVTEPLIEDFHEYYLLDPEVADEDKGDFQVNARGSTAMVEKVIQESTFPQLIAQSLNPAFGQNPKRMFEMYMRAKRLDPTATAYTPEELEKMQATPPPAPPVVQAAQINSATKLHLQDMVGVQRLNEINAEASHDHNALVAGGSTPHEAMALARIRDAEIRGETERFVEVSRANAEASRAEKDVESTRIAGEYDLRKMEMQRDILLLEYAQKQNLTLMQVKGQLANTALQVRAKAQLDETGRSFDAMENQADRVVDVHKHHSALEADAENARQAADTTAALAQQPATPDAGAAA